MKSPIAFIVSVLGCILGYLFLSGTIYAVDEADRQLSSESFQSQDKQQSGISQSQMTRQESINKESAEENIHQEDSSQQMEAKQLEVQLRKLLLLSCPR